MVTSNRIVFDFIGDTRSFMAKSALVEKRLTAIGKSCTAVGRKMMTHLTLPMAAVGVGAAKMASDFDKSMTMMVSLVGVAREQVDAWKNDIMGLSRETARAPQELADAMFFITSAGARGSVALDILRASAQAAAIGLGETKDVAFAAVSAVNAYGAANLDAEQAVATLMMTVREGNLEASTLAPVLGQILPIASELGISFDQVGASIAAMTRLGADARMSSVALKSVMTAMIKPGKQAKDALAALGMSMGDLRDMARTDQGLIKALIMIKDALGKDEEAITKIFPNIRALTGVLNLAGRNAASTEKIFKSLAETTSEDLGTALGVTVQTDAHKLETALNDLKIVLTELGADILPHLVPLAERLAGGVTNISDAFQSLSPGAQETIIRLGGLVALAGPAVWMFGGMATGVGKLIGGFGKLLPMLKTGHGVMSTLRLATGGFSTAAVAGTAGAIGLAGAIGWMIGKAIKPWVEEQLHLNEVLDLTASKYLDLGKATAANSELMEQQRKNVLRMADALGQAGDRQKIMTATGEEGAILLIKLGEKYHAMAKAAREAGTATEGVTSKSKEQLDFFRKMIQEKENAEAAERALTDAAAERYDLMSKTDVVDRLVEMNDEYERLIAAGYLDKQVAGEMHGELLENLRLAKDYNLELPEGVREMAQVVGKEVNPEITKIVGEWKVLNDDIQLAKANVISFTTGLQTAAEVGISLGGGFMGSVSDGLAEGAEKGISEMNRRLDAYIAGEGSRKVIEVPIVPVDPETGESLP